MIALPVRREPAPLATRSAASRALAPATPETPAEPLASEAGLEARVDAALAEALAKVSTPADAEVAKQQAAFDALMQARSEQEREANAIREFGLEQIKKENAFMEEWIKMI